MSDNLDSTTKRCSHCKKEFPATPEYFITRLANRNGIGAWCKNCVHEYNRTPAAKESKKRYAQTPAGKLTAVRAKEKYRPKRIERDRQYNATPKARVARRQYNKSIKAKDAHQRYNSTSNGKVSVKVRRQRYRAKKRALDNTFSQKDWDVAIKYFNGRCAVCGRQPGFQHTLAADHWIPLSSPDCPGTVPMNVIPLCHGQDGCNNSKSNKMPLDWLIQKYGKRKAAKTLRKIEGFFDSLYRAEHGRSCT